MIIFKLHDLANVVAANLTSGAVTFNSDKYTAIAKSGMNLEVPNRHSRAVPQCPGYDDRSNLVLIKSVS